VAQDTPGPKQTSTERNIAELIEESSDEYVSQFIKGYWSKVEPAMLTIVGSGRPPPIQQVTARLRTGRKGRIFT